MFGIGSGELLIILILAVIMIKPEDLPAFVRKVGQVVGSLQDMYRSMMAKSQTFKRELENMASPLAGPESPPKPPRPTRGLTPPAAELTPKPPAATPLPATANAHASPAAPAATTPPVPPGAEVDPPAAAAATPPSVPPARAANRRARLPRA